MDGSEWVGQLFAVVILSALVALLGRNRKIGYGWSFALCLACSPLIGGIIILCTGKKEAEFVEVNSKENTVNSSSTTVSKEESVETGSNGDYFKESTKLGNHY